MEIKNLPIILGVDPGVSGAISSALFNRVTHELHMHRAHLMPTNTAEISKVIDHIIDGRKAFVFIENITIQGPPKEGESKFKIFRSKKLMDNYKQLITIFEMKGIPVESIMPMVWQTALQLRVKTDTYTERKKRFRTYATKTFQAVKVDAKNADAWCLVEYGRRRMIYEPKKFLL